MFSICLGNLITDTHLSWVTIFDISSLASKASSGKYEENKKEKNVNYAYKTFTELHICKRISFRNYLIKDNSIYTGEDNDKK